MARLKADAAVEAVYVVTPNALHRRDVLAAAAAGKHALCEKPMATSARECRDMIAATKAANVTLMIAYRMQYQPHAREAIKLARGGKLGTVVLMDMINNQSQGDPAQWRQKIALAGGGSLPDVGLYCLTPRAPFSARNRRKCQQRFGARRATRALARSRITSASRCAFRQEPSPIA